MDNQTLDTLSGGKNSRKTKLVPVDDTSSYKEPEGTNATKNEETTTSHERDSSESKTKSKVPLLKNATEQLKTIRHKVDDFSFSFSIHQLMIHQVK